MCLLCSGIMPLRRKRRMLRGAVLALTIPLAACAANTAQRSDSWPGEGPTRLAGYTAEGKPTAHRRVRMEADGMESQALPLSRQANEPDDPSEPFSPNYGRVQVYRTDATSPVEAIPIPADLPADFREKLVYATAN